MRLHFNLCAAALFIGLLYAFASPTAPTCPVMLMRFDGTGKLWVALTVDADGFLRLPELEGPCRKGVISYCHGFGDILVPPITEKFMRDRKKEGPDDDSDDDGDGKKEGDEKEDVGGEEKERGSEKAREDNSDEDSEEETEDNEEEEEEEEAEDGESVHVVLDSKQAPAPAGSDSPCFVDGPLVWVAPSSPHLDNLIVVEGTRAWLSRLDGIDKEAFQRHYGTEEVPLRITPVASPMVVKGLPSLGSTSSYFNAALQLLFRASLFREFIKEVPLTFPYLHKDSFTRRLSTLFRAMEEPALAIPRAAMAQLLLALQPFDPATSLFAANEPEYALEAIFDALGAETNGSPWVRRSPALQLFRLRTVEVDRCGCGQRDVDAGYHTYMLPLDTPARASDRRVALEALIEAALRPKALLIEGHEDHSNRRELVIKALPPVLVLQVPRHTESTLEVRIPAEGLDMARFVSGCHQGPPLVYDLAAASLQPPGSESYSAGLLFPGGHWYEITDDTHGQWFAFPDRQKAIGETAGLLVYQLRIGQEEDSEVVYPESFKRKRSDSSLPDAKRLRRSSVDLLRSRSAKLLVKGLPNLGATCYLNSALQLLFHAPFFRAFITQSAETVPGLQLDSVTAQLASLFGAMEKTEGPRIRRAVMAALLMGLQPHNPAVNLFDQNDPEEALTMLFDAVAAETKASPSHALTQLVQLRLAEVDHCGCGQRDLASPLLQYSFKLENLRADEPKDLGELVSEALEPKPLDVEGHGPHLNLRTLHIRSLPPLLIFHVNRWRSGGGGEKNVAKVRFPLVLDMTQYVRGHAGPQLVYDFAAASLHTGNLRSGHYTTGLMLKDGCWYEISDDQCGISYTFAERLEAIGTNAVLLVYQQRPAPGM